jgi:hypothetical protein
MSTPEKPDRNLSKPTLKQWVDWAKQHERKHRAARNKYKAVAELRTKNNRTVVLRFANLTFKEAQAFQVVFDKFNHTHSDADLVFHGYSATDLPLMDANEHNPYIFTPQDKEFLIRQSQYLKQEDRDAIALRIAALHITNEDLLKEN